MHPNIKITGSQSQPKNQDGSMLLIVLFMAVVLTLLVTAMAGFIVDSSQKTSVEVRATRALMAAQSGLEFAFYKIAAGELDPAIMCNAIRGQNIELDQGAGFAQCTVSVDCTSVDINSYTITSEGRCGKALDESTPSKDDISTDFAVSRILVAEAQ